MKPNPAERVWKVMTFRNNTLIRKQAKQGIQLDKAFTHRYTASIISDGGVDVVAGGSSERVAVQRAAALALAGEGSKS